MTNRHDATTLFERSPAPTLRGTRERFAPGSIVAGRYRIVALLGRGGMGEVYRTEDLRLDQQVALKFLPPRLQSNPEALERFLGELRLGRQVSHPNVCRLYDLGDHEGHDFITMEYVDGEDLASLLKRIGKLSADKAVQIARDIAAGLAAAHTLGIVHRDLKPSNVMIDGKGRARVTDFGLAVLETSAESDGRLMGTPAYMAPEQFTGADATTRSDVYALGLILYELLTGEPLHRGESGEAIIRERIRNTSSGSISTATIHDLDPVVDRVLRRCLDPDPMQRPESAQVVLRSLPGGDPLEAAMAAGETPSPELVAAAGEAGELSHRAAWSLLAVMLVAAIGYAALTKPALLYRRLDGIRSPDTLAERGAEIATRYAGAPARDSSQWFHYDTTQLAWLRERVTGNADWDPIINARPSPLRFTYRQSPKAMAGGLVERFYYQSDLPLNVPGTTNVTLDHRGRLLELIVVPPPQASGASSANWQDLFALAELPTTAFTPAAPQWSPPVGSDERRAWTGTAPGSDLTLRIEAAARGGRPVWFAVIAPFRAASAVDPNKTTGWTVTAVLQMSVLLLTVVLAVRNLRRGRGDRRGALRLGLVVFGVALLARLVHAHHAPDALDEYRLLQRLIGTALFVALSTTIAYLGLEPYVRRYQPEALISWVRLVNGRLRDPLVGRHVLIGFATGTAAMAALLASYLMQPLFGFRSAMPGMTPASTLNGIAETLYWMLARAELSVMDGITVAFLAVVFRAVVRNRWAAYALLYLAIMAILTRVPGDAPMMQLGWSVVTASVIFVVLRKAGVLGVASFAMAANVIGTMPLTLDPGAFYAGRALFAMVMLIGIPATAMIVSLGNKPILGEA